MSDLKVVLDQDDWKPVATALQDLLNAKLVPDGVVICAYAGIRELEPYELTKAGVPYRGSAWVERVTTGFMKVVISTPEPEPEVLQEVLTYIREHESRRVSLAEFERYHQVV